MKKLAGKHDIRLARPDELTRIREIEDAAGEMFSGLGLIDEDNDGSFPLDLLADLISLEQVWVACDADDIPVGMMITSIREGNVHVEEMDVIPSHGRHGLGARMLLQASKWAAECGYRAVTLSTFRDVPWNGPFYRKQGFRDLEHSEWAPYMHMLREVETRHGLKVEERVFMIKELGDRTPDA